MTPREIFDKVKTHLLAQGELSQDESAGSRCLYRSGTGLRCAIGCLISDEAYSRYNIEGKCVDSPLVLQALRESDIGHADLHIDLLRALQEVHDSFRPEHWSTELDAIERG